MPKLKAEEVAVKVNTIATLDNSGELGVKIVAGNILSLGSQVLQYSLGESIFGFYMGDYQNQAILSANQVWSNKNLDSGEIVQLLLIAIAQYTLIEQAKIKRGQWVCIIGADSTLGMALAHVALKQHANVIAIVNNREQLTDNLKLEGQFILAADDPNLSVNICSILDVSSFDIVVDVAGYNILQSLQRNIVYQAVIVKFINKNDFVDVLPIVAPTVTWVLLNLAELFDKYPQVIFTKLKELSLNPRHNESLPVSIFESSEEDLLGLMIKNSELPYCTKLLKTTENISAKVYKNLPERFYSSSSYLITGGTSGLGLAICQWLADKGAGQIVLVSRNGAVTEEARRVIGIVKSKGTSVLVYQLDISNENSVSKMFQEFKTANYTLKGIFHCAMVLDDGFMTNMNYERYAKVLNPKVNGVLLLDKYSKEFDLDYFVMTSSFSSVMGNVGQANYVAANSFLDEFTYYRKAHNLPVMTMNIGVIADTGIIARSPELIKYTELISIKKTPVSAILEVMDYALANNLTQIIICDFDWSKWSKVESIAANSSRFYDLTKNLVSEADEVKQRQEILETLGYDWNEAIEILSALVKDAIGQVLRMNVAIIDDHVSLNSLGVDSLMAAELKGILAEQFSVDINLVDILKGISTKKIAEIIYSQLTSGEFENIEGKLETASA